MLYPFVRCHYALIDTDSRKELCSTSYKICAALKLWNANSKQSALELIEKMMQTYEFIRRDLITVYTELATYNPLTHRPGSLIDIVSAYFNQFFILRDQKLYMPAITTPAPKVEESTTPKPKIRAITEETWWVVRVKNEYRMCRLTFDRGEYWEMVEYKDMKVHNPQYRFPKYDNRVVYEFKEHLSPSMFAEKISEAVRIRKEALLKQANLMLESFNTVIIARHLTGGTLVGGVEEEDADNWYLDTYNEHGEHIFFGDTRWCLDKKSRCTVVQILKRK